MSRSRSHFPALVLTLGEPHPGGLADRMRVGLRERFGRDAAALAADLGDLRLNGVLRGAPGALDPRALERWMAGALRQALARHDGRHPARPQLPVLLVADADDPLARARLVACVRGANVAVGGLGLPAALTPRIAAVIGWPARDPLPLEAAGRAAWLRDLHHLVTAADALAGAVLVGRSNYRPDRARTELPLLDDAARDALVVGQVGLLLESGLLEEALSLGRGRARTPWLAFGSAPARQGPADPAWPWVSASDGHWGGWVPRPVYWALGGPAADAQGAPLPRLEGNAPEPLVISCLAGIPARFLAGCAQWEAVYRRLDHAERLRLHRVADACPEVVDAPAPVLPEPEVVEPELVP